MNNKYQHIIGYEKLDNLISGFILGLIVIGLSYWFQVKYYHIDVLGDFGLDFKIPFLKRALLGGLLVFLIFNYLDKLFAMRGVLFSVFLVGIYLIYKMFFAL